MGLLFQLFDDLTELALPLSPHEKAVNPWLHYPDETARKIERCCDRVERYCLKLPLVREALADYGRTVGNICRYGEEKIAEKVPERCIRPLLARLDPEA